MTPSSDKNQNLSKIFKKLEKKLQNRINLQNLRFQQAVVRSSSSSASHGVGGSAPGLMGRGATMGWRGNSAVGDGGNSGGGVNIGGVLNV